LSEETYSFYLATCPCGTLACNKRQSNLQLIAFGESKKSIVIQTLQTINVQAVLEIFRGKRSGLLLDH
jgi:hypothetical protein